MPVNLYNVETGKWDSLSAEMATSALRAKTHQPAVEDLPKLTLKTSYGDGTAKDVDQFWRVLKNGGRLETEAESRAAYLQQFEGPVDKAISFVGGMASGTTLGLSDVASQLLPKAAQERFEDASEANPGTRMAGQATGVVGSAILTGGTSAVAQVAARTPAAMAMKLAAKAGQGAAEVMAKKGAGKGLQEIAKTSAAMAVENGTLGAGAELGEVALDDTLANGEYLAATGRVFRAGATGAAVGGALGGVGGAAVAATRKMSASTKNLLEKHYKHTISDEAADLTNKIALGKITAKSESTVKDEIKQSLADALAMDKVISKPVKVKIPVDDLPHAPVEQAKDLVSTLQNLNVEGWAARSELGNRVKQNLQPFLINTWQKVNKGDSPTDSFEGLQTIYNKFGDEAHKLHQAGFADDARDLEAMQNVLHESLLKKPDVWGKAGQNFDNAINNLKAQDDVAIFSKYVDNPKGLDNLYDRMRNAPDAELEHWDKFITGRQTKIREMINHEPNPAIRTQLNDTLDAFHELRNRVKDGTDHAVAGKIAPHIPKSNKAPSAKEEEQTNILKKIVSTNGLGAAALNIATSGYSGAAQSVLRTLTKLASNAEAQKKVIELSSKGLNTAAKGARKMGRVVATGIAVGAGRKAASDYQRADTYARCEKIKTELRSYTTIASDPIAYAEGLRAQVPELTQMAPRVTQSLVDTKMRGGAYLLLKAQELGISDDPRNSNIRQDTHKVIRMERYIDAVNNPMRHIKQLESGTMSQEAVDVIKNVYPTIYRDVVNLTTAALNEAKGQYSSKVVRQMSALLDYPFDPLYTPEMVQTFQAAHAVAGGQPNDIAGKQSGRPREISNVKHQTEMRENLTPSQQSEAR